VTKDPCPIRAGSAPIPHSINSLETLYFREKIQDVDITNTIGKVTK